MKKYKNRSEVPKKYQWDLSEFYKSEGEWQQEYEQVVKLFSRVEEYKGNLNDSKQLEKFLLLDTEISNIMDDLYVYAYLSHDVDLENSLYIEMLEKAGSLLTEYGVISAFAIPEILNLDEKSFKELFEENKGLEKFRVYLEDIYMKKKHTLTENEEKIISLLTDTYSSYSSISSSLLNLEHDYGKVKISDQEEIEIASNNIGLLKRNKDEKVRKEASTKFGEVLARYQTTESALLNSYVKNSINLAKIRKYDNPWSEYLENKYLDGQIFIALQQVAENNVSINQKYYKLMKKVLKLPILHGYDLRLEWSILEKEYEIEEAEELVLKALQVLGDDYHKKLKKVFDHHYIDYCQYKGKTSGGYSYSTARQNSRILLSFNGQMTNIFTVVHEIGHNVHRQYLNESTEPWYRYQGIIVGEVASLTNEILLANYIYESAVTKEEKLIGLENFIQTFQNNFFGAVMEGQLELAMYDHVGKGNSITAKYLNDQVMNKLKLYRDGTVENDEYTNLMWVTRSHYYTKFYLFNYAICISVATVLAEKIMNKEEGILEKYKEFLSCGSDIKPVDVYKRLGVDLTEKEVYEQAIKYFDSKLDLYEKLSKEGE